MTDNQKIMENQPDHFFLDTFTEEVCKELSEKIKKLFRIQVAFYEIAQTFSLPPKKEWGHWALPCFFLSKKLKKNPVEVARQIAADINYSALFEKTVNKGPYVNFFFNRSFLKNKLLDRLKSGDVFHPSQKKIGSYLIEYSQPNTHKELHIGHMRNLCFGLSLVTLLKKRAFSVISCTYPGDMGTHIAKCLWYLKYHNKEPVPSQHRGQWLGCIYTKAHQTFERTQNIVQKEKYKKQLTEILRQLQKKQGEFYNLWKQTRLWSQDLMNEVYQWSGAEFDHWYWESEMDAPSVKWINQLLKQGKLQLSNSAVGMDLGEPLGFCLLLKSDGNGLYATKDLYLARKKFEDHKLVKNIYIVDQRQEAHFQQVFKVLKNIGFTKEAGQSEHLKYNFVELKTGSMSSRSGNIVPIMTLIEKMTDYIKTTFLKKYQEEWSKEKIENTAYIIAQGAIKYGMNEQDLNKKIVFDMKEWLKIDGRSGPYIQYAYARACTLLKKSNAFNEEKKINADPSFLSSSEEWQLILHLSWFSLTMEKCAWQMKTSPICYYLFELAQKFSRFYQNCPISTLDNEEQKNFRLFLVQVVKKTLKEGLATLAIPVPEQM